MRKYLALLLFTVCTGCTTNNYILMGSATPASTEGDEPKFQSLHEQYRTAVHEAAHALYGAAVYGPSYIKRISIASVCCADGLGNDLGSTEYADRVTSQEAPDLREQMAFAFAGRAGDVVILGKPNAGASSDIAVANRLAWAMVNGTGLIAQEKLGFLVQPSFGDMTPLQKQYVTCELENANARAEAFVRQNRKTILLLADIVMHQPGPEGTHVFQGFPLRVFLRRYTPTIIELSGEPICIVSK